MKVFPGSQRTAPPDLRFSKKMKVFAGSPRQLEIPGSPRQLHFPSGEKANTGSLADFIYIYRHTYINP